MGELRQAKLERSDAQAEQEVAELKQEHDQQLKTLEKRARRHHRSALAQTLGWLLDPENP